MKNKDNFANNKKPEFVFLSNLNETVFLKAFSTNRVHPKTSKLFHLGGGGKN